MAIDAKIRDETEPCEHVWLFTEEFTAGSAAIYVCAKCGANDEGLPLRVEEPAVTQSG